MVGLLYLKHAFNESDESLLERWVENPYWQAFCGFTTMQHESPIHPTSLVKWRNRAGAEKLAKLLQETIALAVREQEVSPQELQQVNVDTTGAGEEHHPSHRFEVAAQGPVKSGRSCPGERDHARCDRRTDAKPKRQR